MVTPQELRDRAELLRQWGKFELGMTPPAALDYDDTMQKLDAAAAEIERLQALLTEVSIRLHAWEGGEPSAMMCGDLAKEIDEALNNEQLHNSGASSSIDAPPPRNEGVEP